MIPMTLRAIAEALCGTLELPEGISSQGLSGDALVTSVVADSREVKPGSLYVAIAGERVDGHDFAEAAMAAGAVGVLGTRATSAPTIVVGDSVLSLGALASHQLKSMPNTTVVALTGSSGKTTTKDLIASVLATHGSTVAPLGSFNTEVGVPLTILRADENTRYLVLEMGMRGLGHIAYLTSIAQPDLAAVLNVGSAHLELLESAEGVAQAKGEIVESLTADGTAILNADDPLVYPMAARTQGRVVLFGESPEAEVRATGVVLDDMARASFTLHAGGETGNVSLALHGEHMVANALAAAAVALSIGMTLDNVCGALSAATVSSKWRMDVVETAAGYTVINDSYNANPQSMRAGLKALTVMGRASAGRTWAVLGEMREIGPTTIAEHDAIGRLAVRLDVSRLIAVGEGTRALHLGAAQEGSWGNESMWVPDAQSAISILLEELAPGDVVLVKASRSIGLDAVAQALIDAGSSGEQVKGAQL